MAVIARKLSQMSPNVNEICYLRLTPLINIYMSLKNTEDNNVIWFMKPYFIAVLSDMPKTWIINQNLESQTMHRQVH